MIAKKGNTFLFEVEKYFNEPCELPEKGTNWDLLKWWKFNVEKYKVLSQIACDVIVVQVRTIASKFCFLYRRLGIGLP